VGEGVRPRSVDDLALADGLECVVDCFVCFVCCGFEMRVAGESLRVLKDQEEYSLGWCVCSSSRRAARCWYFMGELRDNRVRRRPEQ
jgi:hypothetical protein